MKLEVVSLESLIAVTARDFDIIAVILEMHVIILDRVKCLFAIVAGPAFWTLGLDMGIQVKDVERLTFFGAWSAAIEVNFAAVAFDQVCYKLLQLLMSHWLICGFQIARGAFLFLTILANDILTVGAFL